MEVAGCEFAGSVDLISVEHLSVCLCEATIRALSEQGAYKDFFSSIICKNSTQCPRQEAMQGKHVHVHMEGLCGRYSVIFLNNKNLCIFHGADQGRQITL